MFKKAVEAKSHQRLSGADRKKLKRMVKEKFPNSSDADIDVLLPPKTEITIAKLANRAHVYGVEGGYPMFVDIDGRGTEIFPTVYALWQVPELLPAFILKGGEVSHYIIGGADLMFPGVQFPPEGLPSFVAGQLWAVKVPGNMAPIAVGITTMSTSEALKAGLRGKALRITHYYRDSLWESVGNPYVPNEGFCDDVVLADPAPSLASQSKDSHEQPAIDDQNDVGNNNHEEIFDISECRSETGLGVPELDELKENTEEIIAGTSGLKISGSGYVEETKDEHRDLSPEDTDALLDKCLLQALHTSVKDKELPMAGSKLWSSHVLPCRPSGTMLDIKKSTHKKLSKWLLSKSTAGLISVKEDKHKKEIILQTVNRVHPEYTSFQPEKRQNMAGQQMSDSSSCESSQGKSQLDLVELYKPISHVNPVFTAVGFDTGRHYIASEASDVVFRYVENMNLVKQTNKAVVVLDAILCDALYKGTIKKGSSYPTEIHKKDLGATFLNRMQVYHCVTRGNESTIRKGAIKTVQILTERRQGNKKVTRVSGIESFFIDPEVLGSELQKKFACSTTVAELPGKKGHEVLIQGGVIENLAKYLMEHYGIPKRYIEVLDKTKR